MRADALVDRPTARGSKLFSTTKGQTKTKSPRESMTKIWGSAGAGRAINGAHARRI
jgi:hypothetical protein